MKSGARLWIIDKEIGERVRGEREILWEWITDLREYDRGAAD
jgi:hypothetical protein